MQLFIVIQNTNINLIKKYYHTTRPKNCETFSQMKTPVKRDH